MIRARATAQDGRPVIFLGVNRENIRRLVDLNQPIRLTGESVGTPDIDSVIVVFGEDNEQVFERLKHFADVTPDTIVHVEAKKERSPLIVPESLTPNTVLHITWDSRTEKLAATVDHGLLVVPKGPDADAVYFSADDEQLGSMVAAVLSLAAHRNGGRALTIAQRYLDDGEIRDVRGANG